MTGSTVGHIVMESPRCGLLLKNYAVCRGARRMEKNSKDVKSRRRRQACNGGEGVSLSSKPSGHGEQQRLKVL